VFQEVKVPRLRDNVKVKHSITSLEWPRGFQEVKVPRLRDNVKVKHSITSLEWPRGFQEVEVQNGPGWW